jgi:hypothetical protein
MPESKRLYPNLNHLSPARNRNIIIRPRPQTDASTDHVRMRQTRVQRIINSNTTNVFNGPVHGFINEAYGGAVDGFVQVNHETVGLANNPMGESSSLTPSFSGLCFLQVTHRHQLLLGGSRNRDHIFFIFHLLYLPSQLPLPTLLLFIFHV